MEKVQLFVAIVQYSTEYAKEAGVVIAFYYNPLATTTHI